MDGLPPNQSHQSFFIPEMRIKLHLVHDFILLLIVSGCFLYGQVQAEPQPTPSSYPDNISWIPISLPDKFPLLYIDYDHLILGASPKITLMLKYSKQVKIINRSYSKQIIQYDIDCTSRILKPLRITDLDDDDMPVRVIESPEFYKQDDRQGIQNLVIDNIRLGSICILQNNGFWLPNLSPEDKWIEGVSDNPKDHVRLVAHEQKQTVEGIVLIKRMHRLLQPRIVFDRKTANTILLSAYDCKSRVSHMVVKLIYDTENHPIFGDFSVGPIDTPKIEANFNEFSRSCPTDTSHLAGLQLIVDPYSQFISSLEHGEINGVISYLNNHPDAINEQILPSVENPSELTPLELAVDSHQNRIVEFLLSKGASVTISDKQGTTVLHHAAQLGNQEVIEALLSRGAIVNASMKDGVTPLHIAASNGMQMQAAVLIKHGADVNARTIEGATPLHYASAQGHMDLIDLLLENKADIDSVASNRLTPLHAAVIKGHADIAVVLVDGGANLNAKDGVGFTALHLAAQGVHAGDKNLVALFLAHGANVNATSNFGATPLHLAAQNGQNVIAELLIAKGADVNARDKYGHTPLWFANTAKASYQEDVVKLLLSHGAVN